MKDIAIRVENLSKRYRIGAKQGRSTYGSLRESLIEAANAPFRRLLASASGTPRKELPTIWALKDISFEVQHGQVLGIIGRNGAGKSTLLKILSRITKPTAGRVTLRGRIGSLLEVGTGFHPELTGRENIFLNGAILGMKRTEIEQKFDEIVDFAEIEQFLDTPVKHYSSGMYMRLAFAVAAHLEPEILLVDEVLAVGDAAFQQKCLGKMDTVARQGRTVLFVSHNMAAVQRLCKSTLLLDKGKTLAQGDTISIVDQYLNTGIGKSFYWERTTPSDQPAFLTKIFLADYTDRPLEYISTATDVSIHIECVLQKPNRNLQLGVNLLDQVGEIIFASAPQDDGVKPPDEIGKYQAVFYLPNEILMPKTYGIKVILWEPGIGVYDSISDLRFSTQEAASLFNSTPSARQGIVALRCQWRLEKISD
jgi:lipopolysaccharide transport system ATP-binding protein